MVVKDKVGRKRYIVFRVEPEGETTSEAQAPIEISRGPMIGAIRWSVKANTKSPITSYWLTVFENDYGILRCPHIEKEDAIRVLTAIRWIWQDDRRVEVKITTLGTSGTIKRAREKYIGRRDV